MPQSRVMVHQPAGGVSGQASDIEIHAREILKMRERLVALYAHHCGKSPDEIVELQTKGELEGEITSADFLGAVETPPPSIAPGSLRRFESWNAEFGCELRPPPAAREAEAPAAAPPEAEAPPNDLD